MRSKMQIIIFSFLFLIPSSLAYDMQEYGMRPGVTANSILWKIEILAEESYLYFKNPLEKARLNIRHAHERLLETEYLFKKGKIDEAVKTQIAHEKSIAQARSIVKQLSEAERSQLLGTTSIHYDHTQNLKKGFSETIKGFSERNKILATSILNSAVLSTENLKKLIEEKKTATNGLQIITPGVSY